MPLVNIFNCSSIALLASMFFFTLQKLFFEALFPSLKRSWAFGGGGCFYHVMGLERSWVFISFCLCLPKGNMVLVQHLHICRAPRYKIMTSFLLSLPNEEVAVFSLFLPLLYSLYHLKWDYIRKVCQYQHALMGWFPIIWIQRHWWNAECIPMDSSAISVLSVGSLWSFLFCVKRAQLQQCHTSIYVEPAFEA